MLEENTGSWKEKFILQGRQEGREEMLLEVLTIRFGILPQPVTAYIEKTSNRQEQKRIYSIANESASLEVFLDQLQTLPGYYASVEKQN